MSFQVTQLTGLSERQQAERLTRALRATRGNVTAAAELLGLSRRQVTRLVASLELDLEVMRQARTAPTTTPK
jgi:transcriptional regulator with GAF, ATPase, and Fis domain